jgi:hypothetical protein
MPPGKRERLSRVGLFARRVLSRQQDEPLATTNYVAVGL